MPPSQGRSAATPYTTSVLLDVAGERRRQDHKWGPVSRPPLEWLAILAEEFGEVAEIVSKGWVPPESDFDAYGYREELVQTAAVCVSALECLDYGTAGLGRNGGDDEIPCALCHGDGEVCNPGNADPTVAVVDWLPPIACPRCEATGKDPNHG